MEEGKNSNPTQNGEGWEGQWRGMGVESGWDSVPAQVTADRMVLLAAESTEP